MMKKGRREYDQRPHRAQNTLELKPPQPRCFQTTPLAGGVESKILFHARNKKAVAIETQKRPK